MRYRQALKTIDTLTHEEMLNIFDRASYSLAFSSLKTTPIEFLDTEASVALLTFLLSKRELELVRFVPVLLQWLSRYHHLLNPTKLIKMCSMLESACGEELAVLRLVSFFLKKMDPRRFKKLSVVPLASPFYFDPRLKAIVDQKLEREGFFMGLPPGLGLMVSASAFKPRDSNLLGDELLFKRNRQLRSRILHGVNYRNDAILLLTEHPEMSASELSDTLALSYEPAHRLSLDVKHFRDFGYQLRIVGE